MKFFQLISAMCLRLALDCVVSKVPSLPKLWIFWKKNRQNDRSSALFRMKVNKVSRFFYIICYLQNSACVNYKTPPGVQNCHIMN